MSSLDDLIAAKLGTPVPNAPAGAQASASAAGAASSTPGGLDAMISARLAGAPAPASPPPRGALDQAGDFVTALGHHVMKMPHGAAQLVENGAAKLFSFLPDNPVSRAVAKTAADDNQALNDWEAAYQQSTPNSAGAYAGATVGEVAPLMFSGPAKALGNLGDTVASRIAPMLPSAVAKLGGRAAAGAAQGAVLAAAQPVVTAPTLSDLVAGEQAPGYWSQKFGQVETGAALGGALPVAAAGAGALWNAGKRAAEPLLSPSTYAAKQIGIQLGADAPALAGDLAGAPTFVPGSVPTAAQAAADPRLVMLEKSLANENPKFKAALAARENANNAARLEAVGQVAQTPTALQAAIDRRAAVTGPMRARVVDNGNQVPIDGVNSVISRIANGPLGVNKTIGPAAQDMASKVNDFTTVTAPDTLMNLPGSATAPPAMLDALRQTANTYLSKYAPQGFVGTQEQAAMTPVKQAIIQAIDDANPRRAPSMGGWGQGLAQAGPTAPGYRDYLAEFAKRSVPINTMEVGQQLQGKLLAGGLNSAGDAATALPGYRAALAQALRNSDYAIDPTAQAALEGVQSDLQRATISNSIKSGGSDTSYNQGAGKEFLRALGAANGSNVPAALAGGATFATTGSATAGAGAAMGAKKAGGWVTSRVGDALGDLLLDPQKLADALNASAKPAAAAPPTALARLLEQMSPRAKALALGQLLQAQAPQVVDADRQRQGAYQP